jgi:cytochrome P450
MAYPLYAQLRRESPLCPRGPFGSYLISRFADVVYVLRNPEIFSSTHMASVDRTLLGADPPEHTRMRKIVSRAFLPERINTLNAGIRSIAEQLVSVMVERGECDVVESLAIPLPVRVIASIWGVESGRYADMKRWSDAAVVAGSGLQSTRHGAEVQASLAEFDDYLRALVDRRRRQPADDFVSVLLQGEGARALTPDEVCSFTKLLLIAGNETTTNLIGNAMLVLLRRPVLQARLYREPSMLPAFVEETLRFDTPVQIAQRCATRDVEIAGVVIPAGALVMALLASANRDERQFPDPDRFKVDRKTDGQLAFGYGAHFCLGAMLARRKAAIALGALLSAARGHLRAREPLDHIALVESIALRAPARLTIGLT